MIFINYFCNMSSWGNIGKHWWGPGPAQSNINGAGIVVSSPQAPCHASSPGRATGSVWSGTCAAWVAWVLRSGRSSNISWGKLPSREPIILLIEEIVHQLRLVVYPVYYDGFYFYTYHDGCLGYLPSTVSHLLRGQATKPYSKKVDILLEKLMCRSFEEIDGEAFRRTIFVSLLFCFFEVHSRRFWTGVIKLPVLPGIKQCKCMFILRDLLTTVHCLDWKYHDSLLDGKFQGLC